MHARCKVIPALRGVSPLSRQRLVRVALSVLLIAALPQAPSVARAAAFTWPEFDGSAQHTGDNSQESTLGAGTVGGLRQTFQAALPDVADSAAVYLGGASTPGGTRDLIFVTTKDGHIVALDAKTGTQVWSQQRGPGSCHINNGGATCYTTAAPALDPSLQYVYSYGLDGYVHKYQVGDGTEITGGGWPEQVTTKPFDEKGSSDLTTVTTRSGAAYLYVASSGYPGDGGDYQGHVTTINLADGSQRVFNTECSDQPAHFMEAPGAPDCRQVQSAVWARPGVAYDPATDRIYFATGNGDFNPGNHDWGDSVLALNPDGTGANGGPLDSYTPPNFVQLQAGDGDLGSTCPVLLPVPAGSKVAHLALQSGKDGILRLLNLDNLSGQGGPGHTGGELGTSLGVPQGGEVRTTPAVWTNPVDGSIWVVVVTDNGASGLRLGVDGSGTPVLRSVWQNGDGGTSPIVANGVLYYAGYNTVRALDPATGHQLWQAGNLGFIHWESPIVADGMLYVPDGNGALHAYSLPATGGTTATPTATLTSTSVASATGTATATRSATATSTEAASSTQTAVPTDTLSPTATSTTPSAALPYNNSGISGDANPRVANYDRIDASYSAEALRAAGVTPGARVTFDGLTFAWPDVQPGTPDNTIAQGQTTTLPTPIGGSTLAFLGSSTNGPSLGTGTITYVDGSTQSFQLGFSDWTLNGGTVQIGYGNRTVASMPYRNHTNGAREQVQTYLFYAAVPIQSPKLVARITLPSGVNQGALHVFAFAIGISEAPALAPNNIGISSDAVPAAANFDDAGFSYSAEALAGAGISPGGQAAYAGATFNWPGALPGTLDNMAAQGQTIILPTPMSGSALAFLGSATHGPSSGTVTITYADGSSQHAQLGFSDWTLNGGYAGGPSYGNHIVATLPYRNHLSGYREGVHTYLFEAAVPLTAGKVVASVTLPSSVDQGTLHIFALAVGS